MLFGKPRHLPWEKSFAPYLPTPKNPTDLETPENPPPKCPICQVAILKTAFTDAIGNFPCAHPGTCPDSNCIKAYYGTTDKWATPYKGKQKLYCRAANCGAEIKGWCVVTAIPRRGNSGKDVLVPTPQVNGEDVKKAEERKQKGWYVCLTVTPRVMLCLVFPCILCLW